MVAIEPDEDVTKRDDVLVLADPRGDGRIAVCKSNQRLADNLELPFDCGAEHRVFHIVGERFAGGELRDQLGRPCDVFEIFLGLRRPPHPPRAFRLRALRFGGLKPAVARRASESGSALGGLSPLGRGEFLPVAC